MGRTIGLGRIWSLSWVFDESSRGSRHSRQSEQRGQNFLASGSVNSLRISAPQWWPYHLRRERRECEERNEKCEFLARESVNSSPILARQWWRHFRLSLSLSLSLPLSLSFSLSLSLSLSLYLSLTPSAPHAQYRKRFRATYNTFARIHTALTNWYLST